MKDVKSKYGQLRAKLDKSGINGAPIITDAELENLRDLAEEMEKTMLDLEDKPMAFYFRREIVCVEGIINARSTRV